MQINSVTTDNHLYETVADMGLVMSPTKAIEMARKAKPFYRTLPLKEDDVNHICYYGKHFQVHAFEMNGSEVWIDDEYIANARIEWIPKTNDPYHVYGVIDDRYPFNTEMTFMYNENIIFRHSEYHPEDPEKVYTYTTTIKESDVTGVDMYNACYCISQSRYYKAQVSYKDGVYTITCPYMVDIDLFVVGNMQYCGDVDANTGFVVDDVLSTKIYTQMILNHDDSYPVDARFYPWLCIDKDCFIRVYKDTYTQIRNPFACRLINYPEFIDVGDPYNTDNEYLNNVKINDQIIDAADSDEEIYEKFKEMVGEWYRCFESYPYYRYDSAFVLHYNTEDKTVFHKETMLYNGKNLDVIISDIPFDVNRDVIFYEGKMLDAYSTAKLRKIPDEDRYERALKTDKTSPRYVIDGTLDPDKLCAIKFTPTGENTTIKNINYYLDKDNILHLHHKIHKFYRNVAMLQDAAFNVDELGEQVWVGKNEPGEMDEKLWIELLTVADEDLVRILANRIPDSVTGLLPNSLLQKIAENPLTEEEISTELHNLHQDQDITIDQMEHHDIWIQWLNTIKDYVHFTKENAIIFRVNEHIYYADIGFNEDEKENVHILAFDDIVLNYRENKFADRYLSILADLYKSGIVTDKDLTMYYKRLITSADNCSPNLIRLFTYTSSVITKAPREEEDMCIVYSQNMGRIQLTIDHFDGDGKVKLNHNVLAYKNIDDFAYLPDRVMIYLNGQLINPNDIHEYIPYELYIDGFDEQIETVDIMYNLIDIPLMKLRRLALDVLPASGENPSVKPSVNNMEPIVLTGETRKGYYDVLFHDYMENGGMDRRLEYYVEHPDEYEEFKKDLLETFAPITNKSGLLDYTNANKIVLWASLGANKYVIGPKE